MCNKRDKTTRIRRCSKQKQRGPHCLLNSQPSFCRNRRQIWVCRFDAGRVGDTSDRDSAEQQKPLVGRIRGSRLLARAEILWKLVLGSPNKEFDECWRWILQALFGKALSYQSCKWKWKFECLRWQRYRTEEAGTWRSGTSAGANKAMMNSAAPMIITYLHRCCFGGVLNSIEGSTNMDFDKRLLHLSHSKRTSDCLFLIVYPWFVRDVKFIFTISSGEEHSCTGDHPQKRHRWGAANSPEHRP